VAAVSALPTTSQSLTSSSGFELGGARSPVPESVALGAAVKIKENLFYASQIYCITF